MKNKKNFPLLIAALGTISLHAEEQLISETDMFSSLPMVSSVSRISQPVNKAPASITIIDRELIIASGAQNWIDLFRLVPGMQAYSINGSRPGIDYHGIGAEFPRQLEVTVDGRSVYQPLFSTVEWSVLNVTLDDIDYIEIVRGSNAASQGSNAFKGAINIITQRPHLDKSTNLNVTVGSRDTQQVNLNLNHYLGELDYQFNIGFERNDGFPAVTGQPNPEDNGPLADGRDLFTADFLGIYTPSLQDSIEFNIGVSHNHAGWGDGDHPNSYSVAEWDNQFTTIRWNRLLAGNDELNVQLTQNHFKANNDENFLISDILTLLLTDFYETPTTVSPDDVPSVLNTFGGPTIEDQTVLTGFGKLNSNRYDLEVEHRLHPLENTRLTWGVGYRYEDLEAETLLDSTETLTSNSRRLFANLEWSPFNQLTLNAGGLAENNNIAGTIGSSRFSINFHPLARHSFRLSCANAERTPSILEANERGVARFGNTVWAISRVSEDGLNPEKLRTLEASYLYNRQDKLDLDLKLFRERYSDLIYDQGNFATDIQPHLPSEYLLLAPSGKINKNIVDLDLDGAEMQLRYYPNDKILLAFHYTYLDMDGKIFEPTRRNLFRDFGDKVATHTASVLTSFRFDRSTSASVWLYHMNEVNWDDGNTIDEFIRVDAQIRYEFPASSHTQGALSLVGQNLGGSYSDFSKNNQFETRIYLKLELKF